MSQSSNPNEDPDALLKRLSQKPGVQSILILSRGTGAIVRASGLISSAASLNPNSTTPRDSHGSGPIGHLQDKTVSTTTASGENNGESSRAEEVARIVWSFMENTAGLIKGLNGGEDEMRLLRLRTKKNELVIVPDSKFLLVVIHDTPPA